MTYHLIALVEAVLSILVWLGMAVLVEIYSLCIIPYSLMAYSRPQSIHTHLYMNRSLHWVCMEAYSIAHKHVKLLL